MKLRHADSWEALFALEGFISPVDKQLMTAGLVVGDYEMPEAFGLRACGISECMTPHRHGFIVELPNGSVSHVGRHCGKKHFDATWGRQLKRLRDTKRAVAREKALAEARAQASLALSRPIAYDAARLERVRSLLRAFDRLPKAICISIENRAATNDKEIYSWRDPTSAEIKSAKFHGNPAPSRLPFTLAHFEGLLALRPSQRADRIFDERIPAILEGLRECLKGDFQPDEIHTQIRRLDSAQGELLRSMDLAEQFFTSANIEKLKHLSGAKRLGILGFWLESGPPPLIRWTDNPADIRLEMADPKGP